MINTNELYIVNYCHPNCRPFQNIMRLPKEQAFKKAKELAENNAEAQAFYRFADFENYYPRRLKADDIIHSSLFSQERSRKLFEARISALFYFLIFSFPPNSEIFFNFFQIDY